MSKKTDLTSEEPEQNNASTTLQSEATVVNDDNSSDESPKRKRFASKTKQTMPGKVAKRIKIYKTLLPFFQKKYPKCFTIPQSPLAIGILDLLIAKKEDTHTEADIKKFLSMYVNTVTYNEYIIEGANRVDLDGNNVSIISADDADFAKAKIVAIKAARNKDQ